MKHECSTGRGGVYSKGNIWVFNLGLQTTTEVQIAYCPFCGKKLERGYEQGFYKARTEANGINTIVYKDPIGDWFYMGNPKRYKDNEMPEILEKIEV